MLTSHGLKKFPYCAILTDSTEPKTHGFSSQLARHFIKTLCRRPCTLKFVCFSNNLWLISSHKFIHMQTYFCNSASQKLSLKLQNLNAYTRSSVKQKQNFSMQKQKHLMNSVEACICEVSKIAPATDLVVQK